MAINNRYYYLKLHENFFKNPAIIELESLDNGDKYVLILLKLALQTLNTNGVLEQNGKPLSIRVISKIIGEQEQDVSDTLTQALVYELVSENDGVYSVDFVKDSCGNVSSYAVHMRNYRDRVKEKKQSTTIVDNKVTSEVTGGEHCIANVNHIRYKDKDIDIDKDNIKDNNKTKKKNPNFYVKDFLLAWEFYFHGTDRGSKQQGLRNYANVRNEGFTHDEIMSYIQNYKDFLFASGNTNFVYKFSNFLGTARHFENFTEKKDRKIDMQAIKKPIAEQNNWQNFVDVNAFNVEEQDDV